MSEHAILLSKEPELFGDNNTFMALGIIGIRGDKFLTFMDLVTGQIHIEEVFATEALGDKIVGFNYIKDDKLWEMTVYASNSYGLTSQEHITAAVKKLNLKTSS